jgi:hypothetical protein
MTSSERTWWQDVLVIVAAGVITEMVIGHLKGKKK